jgi:6,7-dimethyl-8-ribityllumazine synthase
VKPRSTKKPLEGKSKRSSVDRKGALRRRRSELGGKDLRVAIVASRFNGEITEDLLRGALVALEASSVSRDRIEIFRVPGAFEIPMIAKAVAMTGRFDGIIALGAVIRGQTPHFDYISAWVSRGIGQVGLETRTPIGFGVLTTETVRQAVERASPDQFNRGGEVALTVVEMVELVRQIKSTT